jgi:hypothetical protein
MSDEKGQALQTVGTLSTIGAVAGMGVASVAGVALLVPAVVGAIVGLGGFLVIKATKK